MKDYHVYESYTARWLKISWLHSVKDKRSGSDWRFGYPLDSTLILKQIQVTIERYLHQDGYDKCYCTKWPKQASPGNTILSQVCQKANCVWFEEKVFSKCVQSNMLCYFYEYLSLSFFLVKRFSKLFYI